MGMSILEIANHEQPAIKYRLTDPDYWVHLAGC